MLDWNFLGAITSLRNSSDLKCGHFDWYTSSDPAPLFLANFSLASSREQYPRRLLILALTSASKIKIDRLSVIHMTY